MAASPDSDHELEMKICKEYNEEIIHVMPCIQLSKMANSSLDLNLAMTDINHCKGYVIILDPMSGNLSILLQQCSLNQCVACVIINSEDSLDVTGFVNFDAFTFPVFVLKRENGMQLLKLAAKSKISIKTESVLLKYQKLHTKQCLEFMLKYYKDYWVAGVDIDHARDILKTTWQFFAECDEESTLFEMDPINDHIIFSEILERSFPMMFPVYIFYISTIMSKPDVYTYTGKKECIGAIVDELCTCLKESRIDNIIQYVHQFRSDDKGRWKALANSFLHIVDQWIEVHNHDLPQNIFELAIPLIVIAQMILKEYGAAKGDFQKLWHTHLLKYSDQISFRQQGSTNSICHLYSFKEGMNTLCRLQVPQEFYFTPRHFKELFIRSGKVIPFFEASNMIVCLPENLKHEWQTNFMSDFVVPLREIYDYALADDKCSSLQSFCSQGDWISLLTEGVNFISRVNKFMKNNECKQSFIDISFQWMLMFAKCVDFASLKSSRNLVVLDYIMNEELIVAKHVDFIKEKLCQQLKQSLKHFSPKQFLLIENYTKEKGISDNTIFRDYLHVHVSKLSLHVNYEGDMKSGYHQVLKQYMTRVFGESKLGILDLNLLESVYTYYSRINGKTDFFLDLMKLDISESDLLKLPAKIDKNIREHLLKKMNPHVSKAILDRATIFMKAMGNSEHFMQLVVCQVVLEGLQKLDIKIKSVDNFMNILELAYIHFNDSALLPPVLKSARLKFTCGIVGTLASRMNLKTKCWITDNPGITRMLEIMQPLHAVNDTIPESCIEARTCLQLYHDVKQRIVSLISQLEDDSIPFNHLDYYRKGNCLQELKRIIDIVGTEEKVTEKLKLICDRFNGVRIDVTKILLPSFIANDRLYYGSLLQVLETYEIVLPDDTNTDLMNTIDPQEVKKIVALFKTGSTEIHRQQQLSFNGSRSLKETYVLLVKLETFLGPLVNLLSEICFFQHFKSQFFIKSTKHCLTEPLVTTCILSEFSQAINLSAACQRALSIVCQTAEGDATLKVLKLEPCDSTGKEIAIFEMFATQRNTNRVCYGFGGFKALLSLKNIYKGMGILQEIFNRFELVLCIRDITFEKLLDFSGRLRVCKNVPLKEAYCMKEDFHRGLPNRNGDFEVYFDLFKELRNSYLFVQFLRNKGFIGEAGKRKFSQERNLITQEIQQTLDQRILDDLWDAYSILSIFLDTKITYSALKNGLEKLNNIEKCLLRIKALCQYSIKALDRVFALKDSETKESTMLRLRKLIAFGTAVYDTSDRNSPITLSIVIKENHEFSASRTEELDLKRFSEIATAAELVMISLNEKEEQDICDIQLFLWIYECCLEIIDLLEKLKNAGHFKYQEKNEFRHSLKQWKIEFNKLKTDLTTWEDETPLLREKYQTLSFFSNWKIFQMHKVVTERPLNVRKLEDIITMSLMCVDNKTTKFPPDIHVLKIAYNLDSISGVDFNEPFSVVGELTRNIYESCVSSRIKKNRSVSKIIQDSNHVTHHLLTDSTNFDIYSTALHLLKKYDPITGFQIFTCTTVTTQEAITLFFERVKFLHQYRFIVIDVNVMSLRLQEVVIKECTKLLKQSEKRNIFHHDIIFIESGPSVIRTMPWCFQDHITLEHLDIENNGIFQNEQIECELVVGKAGNGKSHFIQSRINSLGCLNTTIPANESFSVQKCIQKLTDIASRSRSFAIHVNFTIPYLKSYAITAEENKKFQMTCKVVNSFFFNLLICGYVEDFQLGESFSRKQTDRMYLFVEVPVLSHNVDTKDCIKEFFRHFPVFYFLYHQKIMVNAETFDVTMDDTLLVCKYFEADENGQLDKLYKATRKGKKGGDDGIRIASSVNFTPEKAVSLLNRVFFEQHIDNIKIYQKMFVRYMHRRCSFMENSIQMRFFEGNVLVSENGQIVKKDIRTLRSSLLQLMKIEAAELCAPTKPGDGYEPPSMQLIYDEGSFSMITNGVSTSINADRMEIATNHGFQIPGVEELKDQTNLENYLCMALKIKRGPNGQVPVLMDRGYVLTKDYLLKMIAVHERQQCGMPVIISGETGVGKTFLLETLNDIYNYTQQQKLNDWRLKLQNFMSSFPTIKYNNEEVFQNTIKTLLEKDRSQYLSRVYSWFRKMEAQNIVEVFSLIKFLPDQRKIPPSFTEQSCLEILRKFLFGEKRQLFRVFRVHTGLTPSNIRNFIQPIIDEVCEILETNSHGPSVTVFFDEVNTSSCIGFLKELIVDHSLDGKPLPSNIFIVAACNPHRANSISTIIKPTGGSGNEKWFRGNYLVRQLHPSFHQIMWDFGYLKKSEEDEYIIAKLEKIEQNLKKRENEILKQNISYSQELIRQFTRECLIDTGCEEDEAKISSKSAVSQRDIQRVLKLYQWLKNSYKVLKKYGYDEDENEAHHNWHISTRALYVSLALVYYFRLNAKYREQYAAFFDKQKLLVTVVTSSGTESNCISFTKALSEELEWLMQNIELPPGVADTKALRENLFAIITCCMTKIPLIIIGPPGSSKTLSFKIAMANLLGEVSPKSVFRSEVMKGLEPHIYQCSQFSLSEDIDALFEKAILRQNQINASGQNATVVVFMDEAGLPDEKKQVLKVLHYHLDTPKVPFVALTNTALDAAKSNRAVCLFQINNSQDDLRHLSSVMLGFQPGDNIPSAISSQINLLIEVYLDKMKHDEFNSIFGLRDIMHFFSYIRRRIGDNRSSVPAELIVDSLQRNFSGARNFYEMAGDFLNKFGLNISQIPSKRISALLAFKSSLADKPKDLTYENEVRYKLLVCRSEDEMLVQLLFKFGILQRQETKMYCLNKLQGDKLHKATVVAKIKNSIVNGHTITLAQCDEIFESFYDLFNQRFTYIDDQMKNTRNYYARIASGAKSTNCLVHPSFQCIVLVKQSEVQDIPAPFMNRFEKYPLSYESFINHMYKENKLMLVFLRDASEIVEPFLKEIPLPGLYGFQDETLLSLVLAHVKMKTKDSEPVVDCITVSPGGVCILSALKSYCMQSEDENLSEIFEDFTHVLSIMENKLNLTLELVARLEVIFHDEIETKTVDDEDLLNCVHMITQFLCVRMMKELLQFMPPDVFLAVKEKLPKYYISSYLNHQFHFNLQELIKDKIEKSYRETPTPINKTICYSRTTSSLFENLPHEFFFLDPMNKDEWKQLKIVFPDLCDDDINSLCVFKIFHNTTGISISRSIRKFLSVDNYYVMIFLVNMEYISKDTVNYLRFAIEEAEFNSDNRKQFILLLHFPAENFFLHCYPSFCQDNCDFYYLDSVAPTTEDNVIDLKKCFLYAFQDDSIRGTRKFMEEVVDSLLTQKLAVFCAAHIGTILPQYVHQSSVVSLLSTTEPNSIGQTLKLKFVQQWTPHRMMQGLQQAANSALSLEYTLNMSDAISTLIKSNFYDFMYYVLALLGRNDALPLLFRNDPPIEILDLICLQIANIDLPSSSTLMKLQTLRIASTSKTLVYFPSFDDVYNTVENVITQTLATYELNIEKCAKELNLTMERNALLSITIQKMGENEELWLAYMLQFLNRFYSVNRNSNIFTYFSTLSQSHEDISNRIVWLHCSFDLISKKIISFLGLADATSVDSNDKTLDEESLKLLSHPEKCAKAVILKFHESLKSLSKRTTIEDFNAKIRRLLVQYHEMFLSSPSKELIHMNLAPDIEAIRDGITIFFTMIKTDIPNSFALDVLKHFTEDSFSFSEVLDSRTEYLLKIPVGRILDAPFPIIFKEEHATEYSMRYLMTAILEILIANSSEHQKELLIDWSFSEIFTHQEIQDIPMKRCYDSESISCMCFIDTMFVMIVKCDEPYFNSKLEQLCLKLNKSIKSYVPYFLRGIIANSGDQEKLEPLMTLLYLKELKTRSRDRTYEANLVNEYQVKYDQVEHHVLTIVKKEAAVFLMTQETARNIVERSNTLVHEVDTILSKHNYGILLTYCIFKRCKSFEQLRKFMLQEHELCKNFSCLQDIRRTYAKEKITTFPIQDCTCDLLQTFKQENKNVADNSIKIYDRVFSSVREMVNSSKKEIPQNLLDLMPDCCVISSHNKTNSTKCMFKISLFLSVYSFRKKIQVPEFKELMNLKANIYLESVFTDTLCAFISEGRNGLEQPEGLDGPLPVSFSKKHDMWDCVARLIATVLGASERFCNLTMHLLSPTSLDGSFIPGSTTQGKVGLNKREYQEAMGFTESGLCKSYDSFAYIVRGKASLPCMYFIQWANYACLYVHLLGMNSSKRMSPFKGELFTDPASGLSICLMSMEKLWDLFLQNLSITAEQRAILIKICIGKLLELLTNNKLEPFPAVVPSTQVELDLYEKFYNDEIFYPSWQRMIEETTKYNERLIPGSIDYKIMKIHENYPLLPDEHSFFIFLMTSTSFSDDYVYYYPLYQFLLERPKLYSAIAILPDLVNFYQWIHQQFPLCFTNEESKLITIGKLLSSEKYSHVGYTSEKAKIRKVQYSKICESTQLIQTTYKVCFDISALKDDIPLCDVVCTRQVAGLIKKWIDALVNINNSFLIRVSKTKFSITNNHIKKAHKTKCNASSLDAKNMFAVPVFKFDDVSDILPLLENSCCLSSVCCSETLKTMDENNDESLLMGSVLQVYHLNRLQEDVAASMISKLKMINKVQSMSFSFVNIDESVSNIFVESAAVGLEYLEENVPTPFKVEPDKNYLENALKHCHSLSYFSLLEITIGLRIATEYLIQVYKDNPQIINVLKIVDLESFLKEYVVKEEDAQFTKVFSQALGIDVTRLNKFQKVFICEMKMGSIMEALKTFVSWLQSGLYDFSSFSVVLKKELSDDHVKLLCKLKNEAISKGEEHEFLEAIILVNHSLSVSEKKLRMINETSAQCEKSLEDLVKIKEIATGKYVGNFPNVPIGQYVRYRLALRMLHRNVLKTIQERALGRDLAWNVCINRQQLLDHLKIKVPQTEDLSTADSSIDLCDMTSEQIAEFIRKSGFDEKCALAALENEVDGELFVALVRREKHLQKLLEMNSVSFLSFKVRIARWFGKLEVSQLARDYPPQRMVAICSKHDCLKSAIEFIDKYRIDGEMMLKADINIFKQMYGDNNATIAEKIIKSTLT